MDETSITDEQKRLFYLIKDSKIQEIKTFLENCTSSLNYVINFDNSKQFLQVEEKDNLKRLQGFLSPLQAAVQIGYPLTVKLLMKNPNVNINFCCTTSALLIAVQYCHDKIVADFLNDERTEVNQIIDGKNVFEHLLVLPNIRNSKLNFNFHWGRWYNMIALFLNNSRVNSKIDVNKKSRNNSTPLYILTDMIVNFQFRNAIDSDDMQSLMKAFQLLLQKGNNDTLNQGIYNGKKHTPLINVILRNWPSYTQIILAQPGIDVNKADADGNTPFFHAVIQACRSQLFQVNIMLLLYDARTDVNKANNNVITPLCFAICSDSEESENVLYNLLKNPAIDVNKANDEGLSPLWVARNIYNESDFIPSKVDFLLEHPRIDINTTNLNGETLLFHAMETNNLILAKKLFQNEKLDINKANKNGFTPLMVACMNGHIECVKLLLEKDAEKRQQTMTVMLLSAKWPLNIRRTIITWFGKKENLDIHRTVVIDGKNKTAIDLAEENNHLNIALVLRENQ